MHLWCQAPSSWTGAKLAARRCTLAPLESSLSWTEAQCQPIELAVEVKMSTLPTAPGSSRYARHKYGYSLVLNPCVVCAPSRPDGFHQRKFRPYEPATTPAPAVDQAGAPRSAYRPQNASRASDTAGSLSNVRAQSSGPPGPPSNVSASHRPRRALGG